MSMTWAFCYDLTCTNLFWTDMTECDRQEKAKWRVRRLKTKKIILSLLSFLLFTHTYSHTSRSSPNIPTFEDFLSSFRLSTHFSSLYITPSEHLSWQLFFFTYWLPHWTEVWSYSITGPGTKNVLNRWMNTFCLELAVFFFLSFFF